VRWIDEVLDIALVEVPKPRPVEVADELAPPPGNPLPAEKAVEKVGEKANDLTRH
jgi:hypothetical protein